VGRGAALRGVEGSVVETWEPASVNCLEFGTEPMISLSTWRSNEPRKTEKLCSNHTIPDTATIILWRPRHSRRPSLRRCWAEYQRKWRKWTIYAEFAEYAYGI
jgi:hypothetical protein